MERTLLGNAIGVIIVDQNKTCAFCGQPAETTPVSGHHTVNLFKGCACKAYYADRREIAASQQTLDTETRRKLTALLHEHSLKQLAPPFLCFGNGKMPELDFASAIGVDELLTSWPEKVPERIDRCLCNLARRGPRAGDRIQILFGDNHDYTLFTNDAREARYYGNALCQRGWVEKPDPHKDLFLRISLDGWARIEELEGGSERKRNPAFVAMWFGGKEPSDRICMTQRFEEVLRPVCISAGWLAERVDSIEHNDSIIDRIVSMIRVAPFVIADLTENNQGVYYEAGFARGQNVPVIYLLEEGKKPHFDVTGVNHVRWSTDEELRTRLENRILGTMGRGPHKAPIVMAGKL